MSFVLALPLLAQVGIGGALPQAPITIPSRKDSAPVTQPAPQSSQLQQCLQLAMERPSDGIAVADAWLATAKNQVERAGAMQCKAMALTRIEGWPEAAALFIAARNELPATDLAERARLGALGGNAWLVAGDLAQALSALDQARADAAQAGDAKLGGVIQIDRARALVALGRTDEAAAALAEARVMVPTSAQAWLLSATLSRRQGKLADAQAQIERAAELLPIDPEIGLEAGVIAVLSGHDEAARKSWLSVIKAAPGSAAAQTAQGYLDQLGPPAAQPGK
jgi:tetratricopeptide (TPR) repeat protein